MSQFEEQGESAQLPKKLITGMRKCLEAGMSVEAVEASLIVMAGVQEACGIYEPRELQGRVREILRVLEGLVFLDRMKRG